MNTQTTQELATTLAQESESDESLIGTLLAQGKPALLDRLRKQGMSRATAYRRVDELTARLAQTDTALTIYGLHTDQAQDWTQWDEVARATFEGSRSNDERDCDFFASAEQGQLAWRYHLADKATGLSETDNETWQPIDPSDPRSPLERVQRRTEEHSARAWLNDGAVWTSFDRTFRSSGSNGARIAQRTMARLLWHRLRTADASRQDHESQAAYLRECVMTRETARLYAQTLRLVEVETQAAESATSTLSRVGTFDAPGSLPLALAERLAEGRLTRDQRKTLATVAPAATLAMWQESLAARAECVKRANAADAAGKPDAARRYRKLAAELARKAVALEPEGAYPAYVAPKGGRVAVPTTRRTMAEGQVTHEQKVNGNQSLMTWQPLTHYTGPLAIGASALVECDSPAFPTATQGAYHDCQIYSGTPIRWGANANTRKAAVTLGNEDTLLALALTQPPQPRMRPVTERPYVAHPATVAPIMTAAALWQHATTRCTRSMLALLARTLNEPIMTRGCDFGEPMI